MTAHALFYNSAACFNAALVGLGFACALHAGPTPPPQPVPLATHYELPGDCRKATDGITLLACTVYYEARNQPFLGQIAVAHTVLERMDDAGYPKTVYSVVWQPHQYSWTDDPRIKSTVPHNTAAWRVAVKAALLAILDRAGTMEIKKGCRLDGVVSYHERHVHPDWSDLTRRCAVGDHVFYAENQE